MPFVLYHRKSSLTLYFSRNVVLGLAKVDTNHTDSRVIISNSFQGISLH
eukprot:UN19855